MKARETLRNYLRTSLDGKRLKRHNNQTQCNTILDSRSERRMFQKMEQLEKF